MTSDQTDATADTDVYTPPDMSADDFLAPDQPAPRAVSVPLPERGGKTAHVRKLSAAELDGYFAFVRSFGEKGVPYGQLLAWVVCDRDGRRLFKEHQARDLEQRTDSLTFSRLLTAFREANGLDPEALRKK